MEPLTPEEIKEKIRQAEEYVSAMKDESLKKIAFETFLSNILGNMQSPDSKLTPVTQKKERAKKRHPARSDKQVFQYDKISTLELNMDQLKALKEFYDKRAPEGMEASVFTLICFLHDIIGQKKFHAKDIEVTYQNLWSLKPETKPPAMSTEAIRRAMRMLTAPARKKIWIKPIGDGMYELSPQGMLQMTYE